MDIFKQKRYLIVVVVVLVIMNVGTLFMLWIGKPPHPPRKGGMVPPGQEQARLEQLLKVELGFDERQVKQYLKLRHDHHQQAQMLHKDISELKRQMFDQVFQDEPRPVLSDSLLKLVQSKQADLEEITFQHFLDLKKLCKPEQQNKLKLLLDEFFSKNMPPGMKQDKRPPPPPDGKGPPPPPRNN